ncbi:MAG: oligosaccharide flippase family protein [Roseiflexaceae bacterium]
MTRIIPIRAFWQRALTSSYFGSHVILTMGANIVTALLGLITGPVAARLLGPHGRGELAAIQTWPSFIALIAMLGLHEATVYFSARDPERSGQYLASATMLALVAAVPFLAAGYLLMPLLLAAQSPEVITAARWYLLLIPLYALVLTPLNALRGRSDLVAWNILKLVPPLGWFVVLAWASLLGGATPQAITGHYLIVFGLLFFPVFAVVRRRVPGSLRPDYRLWGPMLKYGLPTATAVVPYVLNLRLDQLLMAALIAPRLLGLYAVAVAWAAAMSPLLRAIGAVTFPRVASGSSVQDQASMLAQGARLGTLVALCAGFLLFIITPFAIPLLFGAAFAAAVPCALILVVAEVMADLDDILREGVRGLGKAKVVIGSEIFGLLVAAIALWLFLPPFEIVGAAIASLLGYTAAASFLTFQICRTTGYSLAALLWPRRADLELVRQHLFAMAGK